MTWLDRVRTGFAGVAVPDSVREAAAANVERWLTEAPFAAYRDAIERLIEADRFDELCDAFRQVVPFGTGGRRGGVGVGPNRINPWTVGTSVEGHVRWLCSVAPDDRRPLVVAYDVRRFDDVRGVLTGIVSPVNGLSSRSLAELAARIYAAHGLTAWILPRDASYHLSTPELSFTIRSLGAQGGLNLSASHNPPDDNGVKVYDASGGQLAPPLDQALLDVVVDVDAASVADWDAAVADGRIRFLSPSMHRAYVDAVASVVPAGPRSLGVLYTPLHGTGVVHEVLRAAGFACAVHAPQAAADGAFPTVPNGVANPELPEAMAHALAAAGPEIDVVFGTDPDADRIGAEVRHAGGFVHLTGNDIALLVTHAALDRDLKGLKPLVIQTEVTSSLNATVARARGAVVIDDLLVGFKYVAEVLQRLEQVGSWGDIRASEVVFVVGAEESHGVLATDRIRDKDAAGGAAMLAALAASAKAEGRTLVDVRDALREQYGWVVNDQLSLTYAGATGQQRLAELLDRLRAAPPAQIGDRAVLRAVDHRDERGRLGAFKSESDRAARNVLAYTLGKGPTDDGARVVLRPSGTEPKLKVYVEVSGKAGLDRAGQQGVADVVARLKAAARAWLT